MEPASSSAPNAFNATNLSEVLSIMKEIEESYAKDNQKIILAKKARYLKAINKPELINFDYIESDADKPIQNTDSIITILHARKSVFFDDSIVLDSIKSHKRPPFFLNVYLDCVKAFLTNYLGLQQFSIDEMVNVCVVILTYSRDFDEPSKDLFEFDDDSGDIYKPPVLNGGNEIYSNSNYMAKMSNLIDELRTSFSEEKYRQLNINATYLLMVACRAFVKSHAQMKPAFEKYAIQRIYDELCPLKLGKLPTISEKCTMYIVQNSSVWSKCKLLELILYAYKTKRSLTKRILTATCLQYIKYTGLQLYTSFSTVLDLYPINERQLWDHIVDASKMIDVYDRFLIESLANLADFYYEKHEGERQGKTYELFPYCRVLNQGYHVNLSAKQNLDLTYTLVVLADLKLGLENSFLRKAAWVTQRNNVFAQFKAETVAYLVKRAIENT